MSILNVNQIQPVGSGQTVTINATNIDTGSATVTAGTFTASTNGSERVRITSDGKVSIGGFNPAVSGLSISNSSTNRGFEFDTASGFDSTSCIRAYDRPTTAYKSLGLTGSDIKFGINDVEKAAITSGGDVQIANGNLVFSTSGTGIDFSATANSSGTMTSELLDDYEEGTFTPQMNFTNLSVSSHSTTLGYYVKVGRIVKCDIYIRFNGSNLSGTPTTGGAVWVSGLPYTGSSTGSTQWIGNPTAVGRLPEYRGTNDSTDFNKIYFYMGNNQSNMYLGVNKDPQSPISTDFLYGLSEKSFSGLIGQGYIFELRAGITYIAS